MYTYSMNVLLLPGNSPRHKEWVERLKIALDPHFDSVKSQQYRHWETGDNWADIDYEINVAKDAVNDLSPYILIGKSIGTAIVSKGIVKGLLHPEKIILLGVPINGGVSKDDLQNWFEQIKLPIVIVQNTFDPYGSFAEVKSLFEKISSITFVELPGSTHDYDDFDEIARLI